MDEQEREALRAWGERVVGLEPEIVATILKAVRQMAGKQNLRKADREFAQAQVRSIIQARKKLRKMP